MPLDPKDSRRYQRLLRELQRASLDESANSKPVEPQGRELAKRSVEQAVRTEVSFKTYVDALRSGYAIQSWGVHMLEQQPYDMSSMSPVGCAKGCFYCCCTDIYVTLSEAEEVAKAVQGLPLPTFHPKACPALDPDTKACRAYTKRPLVCRSYFVVDAQTCKNEYDTGDGSDKQPVYLPAGLAFEAATALLKAALGKPNLVSRVNLRCAVRGFLDGRTRGEITSECKAPSS